MKTELDLSNMSGLDDSLLQNYSSADATLSQASSNTISSAIKSFGLSQSSQSNKQLGDGLFKKGSGLNLSKKHIDGTVQDGFLINDKNEYRGGETDPLFNEKKTLLATKLDELKNLESQAGDINVLITRMNKVGGRTCSGGYKGWIASNGNYWCDSNSNHNYFIAKQQIDSWQGKMSTLNTDIVKLKKDINEFAGKEKLFIPVPTDKGKVHGDGEGNYFYFPELPEFIKAKIAELEKLKKEADEKQAAKIAAENKSAAEREKAKKEADAAEKKFQLQKLEAEKKAKEEERKTKEAEAKRIATEKEAEIKLAEQSRLKSETESKAKTKKMLIIGGSVAALVVGFLLWRKFGK